MVELFNFLMLDQGQVITINFVKAARIREALTKVINDLPLVNRRALLDFLINSCDQVYKPSVNKMYFLVSVLERKLKI